MDYSQGISMKEDPLYVESLCSWGESHETEGGPVTVESTNLSSEYLWGHRFTQCLWTWGEGDGQGAGEFQHLLWGTEKGWQQIPLRLSLALRIRGELSSFGRMTAFCKPHNAQG